ncbi:MULTISPECIES: DUF3325 domain-containing protein [unclassified Pseudomonas]|uniref:DUF3325 domain-containing protein n=1 Tax=unclassified Pseudomonas TaxID=196821 RepID=UPI0003F67A73|nr:MULTISPECIES: DUF3325 domain-containing protein [unclassified Pseudomonas]ATP51139.1 DUF3325 domain-containing protein [Pseudomonas putida]MDE4538493.1 DUF3325 domain-containing protein [Pseudomonas sp. ITEM 17296]SMF29367.1 Protein of unknown function [Pseudomonas sp. LAIL14HWK12:I11]SMR78291.1 Protein of unknown function [Pseudomonas sp. LAIL14HWK12:I10]SOD04573.1 Protein of unknown function [Pseudomonas sp. LAIL14HWK12:I8]
MMMWVTGGMLFAYVGMLALCQGLERHYKHVWNRPCPRGLRLGLRGAGWLALLVSLLLCAQAWGWAMGPVAWFGALSLAGMLLVMLLPYWPRLAVGLSAAVPVWGVMLLLA